MRAFFTTLLQILDPKLEKVVSCLREGASAAVVSLRELDSIRGRIKHYTLCIRHTRILATEITWLIGTEEEPTYDENYKLQMKCECWPKNWKTWSSCKLGRAGTCGRQSHHLYMEDL